jgi:hypothetical protein
MGMAWNRISLDQMVWMLCVRLVLVPGYAVGLPDRLPVPVMALAMLLATFLSLAGSIDERV